MKKVRRIDKYKKINSARYILCVCGAEFTTAYWPKYEEDWAVAQWATHCPGEEGHTIEYYR